MKKLFSPALAASLILNAALACFTLSGPGADNPATTVPAATTNRTMAAAAGQSAAPSIDSEAWASLQTTEPPAPKPSAIKVSLIK